MITRDQIVTEALTWVATPYRHQASLKGIGCDCLGLIRGVWRALYGDEPETAPDYTPDWAEAKGTETLAEAAGRHMTAVAPDEAEAGDVLLFRWRPNLPAKHAGILIFPSRSDLRSSSPLIFPSRSDLRSSSPLIFPSRLGLRPSSPLDRFVHAQEGAAVTTATLTPWWRRRVAYAFRFPELAPLP